MRNPVRKTYEQIARKNNNCCILMKTRINVRMNRENQKSLQNYNKSFTINTHKSSSTLLALINYRVSIKKKYIKSSSYTLM